MSSVWLIRPARGKGKRRSKIWVMVWRENGRLRKKSTGTKDRDAAKQIANAWARQLALARHGLVDPFAEHINMTWAEARKLFVEHIEKKHKKHPDTVSAFFYCLNAFEQVAKPKLLRDVTTKTLQDYAADRLTVVSAPTVNKDLRHVRVLLRWSHERYYLRTLPEFKKAFVREDCKLPVVIAPEVVEKLLAAIDTAKLRHRSAFWWLAWATIAHKLGPRRGEILGLLWGAVDFRGLRVSIASTISKGRRDRVVPIDYDLAALLGHWWLASGEPSDGDAVFPWDDDPRKLYDDWQKVCTVAGVRASWKNFRSTCGSELLNSGTPSVLVRDWLGHSSVATTEKFYLAPSQDALREAMERRNSNGSGGNAGGNARRGSEGFNECS